MQASRPETSSAATLQTQTAATLTAVTDEARYALGQTDVHITAFPFKIGRESRRRLEKLHVEVDRRLGGVPPLNDVYLLERPSESLHISREHLAICHADGKYFVVDRESACGLSVGGKRIGGDRSMGRADLHDGDLIVIGAADSPYIFRFKLDA